MKAEKLQTVYIKCYFCAIKGFRPGYEVVEKRGKAASLPMKKIQVGHRKKREETLNMQYFDSRSPMSHVEKGSSQNGFCHGCCRICSKLVRSSTGMKLCVFYVSL